VATRLHSRIGGTGLLALLGCSCSCSCCSGRKGVDHGQVCRGDAFGLGQKDASRGPEAEARALQCIFL
jgi:hypothetical protein